MAGPLVPAQRQAGTKGSRPKARFPLVWVPNVLLVLDGGGEWAMTGKNSMLDVNPGTACVAFVEMKGVAAGDGRAPAVILGGAQMEDFVLDFDMEKKRLGFSRLPHFTGCGGL